MTVLSAQSIRKLCIDLGMDTDFNLVQLDIKNPMIFPFCEKTVFEGKSYGLTCAGYDIRIAQDVELWPGDFLLASSIEYFRIPKNIRGTLWNKSSWAREGLDQSQTILEPGWEGYLTLELKNINPNGRWYQHRYVSPFKHTPLKIKANSPIAQVCFEWLDEETDTPYKGKYQHQKQGPQEAIYEQGN